MRLASDRDHAGDPLALQALFAPPPAPIRQRMEARCPGVVAIAPGTPEEVADALALCSAAGWTVHVCGAATRVREHPPAAVLLSAARLQGITEHEPADLVIGVQAGTSLAELQRHLEQHDQWLPLDPPVHGDATIGGVVAQRLAGPLRALHGTPRDMVLGAEVVTGDGRRLRFGGRVVKNVAGYDAVRLLVGSAGSLGVLTHLYLRLRGLPRRDATLLIPVSGPAEGLRIGRLVRESGTWDALELLSPRLARSDTWAVAVRMTGSEPGVEDAVARLQRVADRPTTRVEASANWWGALALREAEAALDRWRSPLADLDASLASIAHADPLAVHLTDGTIRSAAGAARRSPPPAASPGVAELTRRLRATFDPAGILNPRNVP